MLVCCAAASIRTLNILFWPISDVVQGVSMHNQQALPELLHVVAVCALDDSVRVHVHVFVCACVSLSLIYSLHWISYAVVLIVLSCC